jgi:hypothetical protein
MGENPGGGMSAMLVVEERGVEYERNSYGAPILPAFKTAEPSRDLLDAVYVNLPVGEVCMTNGPVFSDYDTRVSYSSREDEPEPARANPELPDEKLRSWALASGRAAEAEYVATVAGQVVLRDAGGTLSKIPLEQFSVEDAEYIELQSPPEFSLDFSKKRHTHKALEPGPFVSWIPPTLADYTFSARVKQATADPYSHELQVEYFAFGREAAGDRYILLDRRKGSFSPGPENGRSFALQGEPVLVYTYTDYYGDLRGKKYDGYLIILTDPQGKIVAHRSSDKWLFEHRHNLEKLAVGHYLDKTGLRVFPTRPRLQY